MRSCAAVDRHRPAERSIHLPSVIAVYPPWRVAACEIPQVFGADEGASKLLNHEPVRQSLDEGRTSHHLNLPLSAPNAFGVAQFRRRTFQFFPLPISFSSSIASSGNCSPAPATF